MKYYSFCPFILAVFIAVTIHAQNLVSNPSFEEYLDCPQSTAEFQTQVVDWYSFSVSPDYFNSCNNEGLGTAGVPHNAWGYQYSVSGNAYAGVITFTHTTVNEREYIATSIPPLTVNDQYYVMFFISHCDGGVLADWRCSTDHFGLKFFNDPTYSFDSNPYTPQNTADIEYNEMFTDTTNWHLVEGWFTADQAYNWIALGNFYDDAHTDTLQQGNPENVLNECYALYYIDNVCISKDPADCEYLLNTHQNDQTIDIDVFPNPVDETFSIRSSLYEIENILIYELSGKLIYQEFNHDRNIIINSNQWASGIYLLQLELDDNIIYHTKIIKR